MNWIINDRVNNQHRDFVKKLLYYGGYYSLYEKLHRPSENRLLILMYHSVVPDRDQRSQWYRWNTPSQTQFEAALITLKKYYRVMSVEDAVQEIKSAGSLREPSAAITLDDGYLSSYDIVFPLLKKHGLTATIYLPTDWIDGRMNPWWMELTAILDQGRITPDTIALLEKIMGLSVGLTVDIFNQPAEARKRIMTRIEGVLMRKDDSTRNRLLQELRGALVEGQFSDARLEAPMTWAHINEMASHGIRFGAHTCLHPNLSYVDLETAEREIVESKRIIESHLGTEVSGFAYPYGYDVAGYQRFRPILEKHGFLYACTTGCSYVDSASDRYLLGRIGVPLSTSNAIIARTLTLEYCARP
ncbi:MAG: polysaccharide deacetylase family protein [candidate division Zixibacteria bacterium]|nr:polysaccharide deacetylase family protein [candidate division Zixibacteria bacterium]